MPGISGVNDCCKNYCPRNAERKARFTWNSK